MSREVVLELDGLLALSDRDTAQGLPDAPWPPHYPKAADEPVRAQPSRRRRVDPEQPSNAE